jgi:hypothetical protein
MQPTDDQPTDQPKPASQRDPLVDPKTTASATLPGVMSAFEAADRWGIWYGPRPAISTRRNRPPYSITD